MVISNSSLEDLSEIFRLYDLATNFPFEELQPELESQVGKDSRSQLVKAKMLEQLLVEYQDLSCAPQFS